MTIAWNRPNTQEGKVCLFMYVRDVGRRHLSGVFVVHVRKTRVWTEGLLNYNMNVTMFLSNSTC